MKARDNRKALVDWFYEMRVAELRKQAEREAVALNLKFAQRGLPVFIKDSLNVACGEDHLAKTVLVGELLKMTKEFI